MSQARAADGKFTAWRDEDRDEGPNEGDKQTSTREQETTSQAGMQGRNKTEAKTTMLARSGRSEKVENEFSQTGVEKMDEVRRRGSPTNEKEAQEMRMKLLQMEDELRPLEDGYPTPPQEKNERISEMFSHDEGTESAETEESVESKSSNEDSANISNEESSTSDSLEEEKKKKKK